MTKEQHNHLVDTFNDRAKNLGIKPNTKKFYELQCEFFLGAISLLSMGVENYQMPVKIYVAILRSDAIKRI